MGAVPGARLCTEASDGVRQPTPAGENASLDSIQKRWRSLHIAGVATSVATFVRPNPAQICRPPFAFYHLAGDESRYFLLDFAQLDSSRNHRAGRRSRSFRANGQGIASPGLGCQMVAALAVAHVDMAGDRLRPAFGF